MMKRNKRWLSLALSGVMLAASPTAALAASPDFAYSSEDWERLRDNVMEYEELPALVEEYNPTYLNNRTTYQDGRESRNAREVREKQYESAYDAYDSAENLRSQAESLEDSGALMVDGMASAYSGIMAAAYLMETTALKTEQAADASYQDSEMDRLEYMRQQDGVIVQTQGLFAGYNQLRKTVPLLEKNLELAEMNYKALERRSQLGQATQIDLLNGRNTVQSLKSSLTETSASLESLRQQLCLMTGWDYDGQPEIRDLPRADTARIASMDPAADAETALAENLSLKYNLRALGNMSDGSADKKNMERTIKNQQETIRATMVNLYNDILQKQTALQAAQAALTSGEQTWRAAGLKYQLGSISSLEYLQQEVSYLGCQIDAETANMNLQQAIETYEWALKGYMN